MSVRVGVVGVGYLGAHHAAAYSELAEAELVGVVDTDAARAEHIARQTGSRRFESLHKLLPEVEAVSVVVPTTSHASVAGKAFAAGVHVLVEKPIAATVDEAASMVAEAADRGLILQVGHLERFNPAFTAVKERVTRPAFVESHRLSGFAPRGTDVPVVLDLMIHDIDLVLWALGSEPETVDAVGIPVLSAQEDIANARLGFSGGAVANLTVSRVSREKVRKIRFFQHDSYVSVDLLGRTVSVFGRGPGGIEEAAVTVDAYDPLRRQLSAFLLSVRSGCPPEVDGAAGTRALRVAMAVMESARTRREAIVRFWAGE
jgi:predicted dehydrogenase